MARRKTAVPQAIVVQAPAAKSSPARRATRRAPARRRITRGRAGRVGSRAGGAIARRVHDERHTIASIVTSALFGLLKRQQIRLPKVDALGTPGTYGIGAFLLGRFLRNETLVRAATGPLSVAAYQLAAGDTLAGEDLDDFDI